MVIRDFAFGKAMRAARRSRRLTQFDVAQFIECTPTYICNLERAQINVTPEVRKILTVKLGLDGKRK